MFSEGIAYAMAGGGGAAGGSSGIMALVPLVAMFVIFYFLLIRPQQKRAKEHRDTLAALKKGDLVVTSGGLYGKIVSLTDSVVTLEVADNVRVKVARSYVAGQAKEEIGKVSG
jgi:preprotein translocase subunit YajC